MDERLRQLITLGREHYVAREFEKAERYLAQVVQEHRGFADIFNMLGVIYHEQGRFTDAQQSFEGALKINPNYTEAALNLSVTYNDLGKYDKAREVYSRAVSNSHRQPRSLDPFARGKIANMHADLGAVYASVGFYEEGIGEYRRALEMCPSFVDVRTRLANVYRDAGDYDSALAEFAQIKLARPDYLPARVALGVTLFSLGRVQDAIDEWELVLGEDPTNKTAGVYLKMVRAERNPPAPGAALARKRAAGKARGKGKAKARS
jgi:tetratricopeptide (TPR) repeat protein